MASSTLHRPQLGLAIAGKLIELCPETGGPAGGNGGQGGHIWAVVDEGLNSLSSFRRQLHFRAKPGTSGVGSCMHGARGADVEIPVPRGTVIRHKDAAPGQPPLAELVEPGQSCFQAAREARLLPSTQPPPAHMKSESETCACPNLL